MELNIVQLDRTLPDGVVVTCHWTASLTDGDYTASFYGAEGFNLEKDPADPDFIPYEDLTEEVVKGWVLDNIGAYIERRLVEKINEQKNPTSASGLPWTQNEEQS